jgi:hypothetical protein
VADDEPRDPLSEEVIRHYAFLLRTSPEHAQFMALARRAEIPLSEAMRRWSRDDLAWEMALDEVRLDDSIERCPECGVNPADQLQPGRRLLGLHPAMRLDIRKCDFCDEADELQKAQTPSRSGGVTAKVRYVPRRGDEPFFDEARPPEEASTGD